MSATETVTLTRAGTRATAGEAAAAPAEPVTIPKNLGPVRLVREIGKGGMGSVWLAHHDLLNQDVAVKFMLNMVQSQDDPGFATFLEGARAAAALRHRGLNAVLNADVIEGVPFIVMDYVEGPTLAQVLQRVGALSPAAARVVLESACDAVGELHDHGIVHRDIKPANILLASDGAPVLTDFGLACMRPAQSFGARVEGVAGTPAYMAPEMFDKSISARSDVYALGIMMVEVLTGNPPFDGTLDEVRRAHRETPVPLDRLCDIHPALADVVERATNKNPMYRMKSARHMLHAVQEAFAAMDPMKAARAKGEAEISTLLTRWTKGEPELKPDSSGWAEPSTYYDRLTHIARQRKSGDTPASIPADAPSLVDQVPAGVACARCATPLAGQPVTGRCPGCLLLIRLTLEPDAAARIAPPPAPPAQSASDPPPGDSTQAAPAPAPTKKESWLAGARRFWREFFSR